MARPIQQRRVTPLQQAPVEKVDVQQFWDKAKGINTILVPSRVGMGQATEATNVHIFGGNFVSRGGLVPYGVTTSGATGIQLQVVNFVLSDGSSYVIRFDTDHIYSYNGTAWIMISGGPVFTGGVADTWTYTGWNNTLIVSNGVDGTFTLDPLTSTLSTIGQAPAAKQLTTYASRVIASNTLEVGASNRIRWSTKDSSTDWTGIGSGYEDLLSTPGGQTDTLCGVYPISEEAAFIVRSDSIWQMSQTGDPDAPFRFSRTYHQIGSSAPNSIQSTPDGVVFFSRDNIYYVGLSGVRTIGNDIRRSLSDVADLSKPWGLYNPFNREYHMGVGEASTTSLDVDWVYSFIEEGWTRYEFPFNFLSLGATRFTVSAPIDSLVDTIELQAGTINNLGIDDNGEGMLMVGATAGKFVMLLDPAQHTDSTLDGLDIDSPITVATGVLSTKDHTSKTKVIEIELEYEAEVAQTLTFNVSGDGGVTWNQFGSSKSIAPTTRPQVIRTVGVVSHPSTEVQVTSLSLGGLTIVSLYISVVSDGRINP